MNNIKLSVTIVLPGSTMMTSQECEQNPMNYNDNFLLLTVKKYDPKTKKTYFKKEPLNFKTRGCYDAQQVIKMSDVAYDYMTSSMCPEWYPFGINQWKRLPAEARLKEHLNKVCKDLKGKSYSYIIFDD